MLTTLCYIEKDEKYLMLHRIKKEKDLNKDKWVGVGGKFEEGETPEECLRISNLTPAAAGHILPSLPVRIPCVSIS